MKVQSAKSESRREERREDSRREEPRRALEEGAERGKKMMSANNGLGGMIERFSVQVS